MCSIMSPNSPFPPFLPPILSPSSFSFLVSNPLCLSNLLYLHSTNQPSLLGSYTPPTTFTQPDLTSLPTTIKLPTVPFPNSHPHDNPTSTVPNFAITNSAVPNSTVPNSAVLHLPLLLILFLFPHPSTLSKTSILCRLDLKWYYQTKNVLQSCY